MLMSVDCSWKQCWSCIISISKLTLREATFNSITSIVNLDVMDTFLLISFLPLKVRNKLKKKTEARVGIEPTIRIFKQTPSGLSGARTQPSEPSKHSTFFYQFLSSWFFPPSSPWSDQSSCEWFENWEVFVLFLCQWDWN